MDLTPVLDAEALDELEDKLLARAFLYEPPQAYRDAVEEAFDALRSMIAHALAAA